MDYNNIAAQLAEIKAAVLSLQAEMGKAPLDELMDENKKTYQTALSCTADALEKIDHAKLLINTLYTSPVA